MTQGTGEPVDREGERLTNTRLVILVAMLVIATAYVGYIAGPGAALSGVVAGLPAWYWSTFAAGGVLYVLLYLFLRDEGESAW